MNDSPRASGASKIILVGFGAVIALLGLLLAAGGTKLASLGGSWYFLIGGLAMAIAGILIARSKVAGAWLYAAFLLGTALWAVIDTGLVFWPLFSRLFMFAVIGTVVALVYPLLKRANGTGTGRGAYAVAGVMAVAVVVAAGNMFVAHPSVAPTGIGPGVTAVAPAHAQKTGLTTAIPKGAAALPPLIRSTAVTSTSCRSPGPTTPAMSLSVMATVPKTS